MDLKVETMNERHIERCVKLFMDTFSKPPWNERYDSTLSVRRYFEDFIEYDNFIGFVGFIGDEPAALCMGMKKPWLKGEEYYIDQFCVAHGFQRQGVGSLFLKEIEHYIISAGLNGIMFETERAVPAYDFYTKNGFKHLEGLVTLGKEL